MQLPSSRQSLRVSTACSLCRAKPHSSNSLQLKLVRTDYVASRLAVSRMDLPGVAPLSHTPRRTRRHTVSREFAPCVLLQSAASATSLSAMVKPTRLPLPTSPPSCTAISNGEYIVLAKRASALVKSTDDAENLQRRQKWYNFRERAPFLETQRRAVVPSRSLDLLID